MFNNTISGLPFVAMCINFWESGHQKQSCPSIKLCLKSSELIWYRMLFGRKKNFKAHHCWSDVSLLVTSWQIQSKPNEELSVNQLLMGILNSSQWQVKLLEKLWYPKTIIPSEAPLRKRSRLCPHGLRELWEKPEIIQRQLAWVACSLLSWSGFSQVSPKLFLGHVDRAIQVLNKFVNYN